MRYLNLGLMLLITGEVWAKRCLDYENAARYMNTRSFLRESREHRRLHGREPDLPLGDINQARAYSMRFPAFDELGFGQPGTTGWKRYACRMPKSVLNGKNCGFEISNERGHARVRLDYDPVKGAHYNIEITPRVNGASEQSAKLAVLFPCNGRKCSELEIGAMADRMFPQP
jgi:hypothetical protein